MIHTLKYSIKLCVAYTLYYSGLLHLYRQLMLGNNAIVLMYHRVLTPEEKSGSFSHEGIIVDQDTFEMHISFLKKYFNVLSVDEFAKHIKTKTKFEPGTCLITFDDGWSDNHSVAFPILSKHRMPAIIFVATAFIGTSNIFWQEKLASLLYLLYSKSSGKLLRQYNLEHILNCPSKLAKNKIKKFVNLLKSGSIEIPQQMIAEISSHLHEIDNSDVTNQNIDSFLSWTQINEMINSNIAFGSHTVNHEILPKLNANKVQQELSNSKSVVESKTKKQTKYFAYPNGDYNNEVSNNVKNCGYNLAFTTERGTVSHCDEPYKLKRINIHNDVTNNAPMFYCHILGIF